MSLSIVLIIDSCYHPGFVFGGNMTDRVVAPAAPKETEKTSSETSETPEKSDTGDKDKGEETAEGSGDTADSNKVSLKELEVNLYIQLFVCGIIYEFKYAVWFRLFQVKEGYAAEVKGHL